MKKYLKKINYQGEKMSEILTSLANRQKLDLKQVIGDVENILAAVKQEGEQAALRFTQAFDQVKLTASELEVTKAEIKRATAEIKPEIKQVIEKAAANIYRFHKAQLNSDVRLATAGGGELALVQRALARVGVYVPGGLSPLPSSVLMNIIPAKAAGVAEVIMCTPPRADGLIDPHILAAADIAGVDRIFKVGGAQAIACMAYGTEQIPQVEKICGPGNIYVNTAKRLLYGWVDIDMFAGPSEIIVVADQSAKASFVALDLLSQAEHDPMASAILLTNDPNLAAAVELELAARIPYLAKKDIIEKSLQDFGAIVVVPDLETALDFANELAPEHLEICVAKAVEATCLKAVKNAGAVFLGNYSPEAAGDYYAGANHVLPTSGTARFFSPLNTNAFIKKMSVIRYTEEDLKQSWQDIALFAETEHLNAHADSVRVRFGEDFYRLKDE